MKHTNKALKPEISALLELIKGGLHSSYTPNSEIIESANWGDICRLAQQQTLLGVAWDGVLKLPTSVMPPRSMKLKWYATVQRIERTNHLLNTISSRLYKRFNQANIKVMMVKGQVAANLYPTPSHRQCGDIDLYASGEDFIRANAILAEISKGDANQNTIDHNHYVIDGITIELHHKLISIYGKSNRLKFANALKENYPNNLAQIELDGQGVDCAQLPFHESYILLHLYKHLILFGVGLRQIIDWSLCASNLNRDNTTLTHYNSIRSELSSIAVDYLGFTTEDFPHYNPNNRHTTKLLELIIADGNFGKNKTSDITSVNKPHAPWLLHKSNSFAHLLVRWFKIFRITPGNSLNYMIGSTLELTKSALSGKGH